MHDPHDLVQRHLALFNQGVRSGDFGPMLDQFTDDAELIFYNIPVGPFQGKRAIAAAYQTQPPDDEMTARAVQADEGTVCAVYAWGRAPETPAGTMILTPVNGQIARLVVYYGTTGEQPDAPTG
jgi:steroid delta-isomerase